MRRKNVDSESICSYTDRGIIHHLKKKIGINLENLIFSEPSMSERNETDMAKRIRQPVRIGTDANGEAITKWVSGYTIQEVIEKAAQLMAEQISQTNILTKPSTPLKTPEFMEYAWKWHDIYHEPKVRENVSRNTRSLMTRHYQSYFGGRALGDITTTDIQQFFNKKKNLSASTCQKLLIYLSQIFDSAIEDGLIEKNPAKSKRITYSKKKTKRKVLSREEAEDILHHLYELTGLDRLLIGIPLLTGIRRGELLALRWEDFNFDVGYLRIGRALMFRSNQPVIGEPKSKAGYRDIPISAELYDLLEPYRQAYGYIFTREDGTLFTQTTFKRSMERIRKTIPLHDATEHVFRHTFVTTAAESGMDVKSLQSIAGHSDVQTTLDVYTHARREKIIQEKNRISGMYQVVN